MFFIEYLTNPDCRQVKRVAWWVDGQGDSVWRVGRHKTDLKSCCGSQIKDVPITKKNSSDFASSLVAFFS